jgi:hypothetical protein
MDNKALRAETQSYPTHSLGSSGSPNLRQIEWWLWVRGARTIQLNVWRFYGGFEELKRTDGGVRG